MCGGRAHMHGGVHVWGGGHAHACGGNTHVWGMRMHGGWAHAWGHACIAFWGYWALGAEKFVEVTVNILVLICIGATQAGVSGFTSLGGLGSFSIDSMYSPFQGTELQEVTELDMQYSQMRAPCVYGGIAFSLTMMCLTLLFLIGGAKPIHRLSLGLLAAECLFDILACLGYIAAVGLYLHFIIQVNATDVCLKRERLYARRGYTSMNCSVQGGDASVALFGLVAACLYFGSLVVCILTIREVRLFQKQRDNSRYNLQRTYREDDHPKPYRKKENIPTERTLGTLVRMHHTLAMPHAWFGERGKNVIRYVMSL
ncbi:MARVEL domain-containing protein 3, partial [Ophiophagus hannah]